MVEAVNDLCCRVCGAKFTSRDDIEEDAYGAGFWCPECDGYTPYADSNRSSDIDLSVCLETKAVKGHESESNIAITLSGREGKNAETAGTAFPG